MIKVLRPAVARSPVPLLLSGGMILAALTLAGLTAVLTGWSPLAADNSPAPYELVLAGDLGGTAQCIAVTGDLVITGVGRRVHVVDFTEPEQPRTVARTDRLPARVTAVAVAADHVYAAVEGGAIHVFDIRDPRSPRPGPVVDLPKQETIGALTVAANRLYAAGKSGGLYVIDITQPGAPWRLGNIDTIGREVHSLVVRDPSSVFISDRWGFSVVDASDPRWMRVVSRYGKLESWSATDGALAVHGRYAYLAMESTLRVLDVGDPVRPRLVDQQQDFGQVLRLVVQGERLFLLEGGNQLDNGLFSNTLYAADLTLAPNLDFRPVHELAADAPVMVAEGSRLFVADAGIGLQALEISDAPKARVLGVVPAEHVVQTAFVGDRAAIAIHTPFSNTWRIDFVNVAQLAEPSRIASLEISGDVVRLAAAQDRLVVLGSHNLSVIDPAARGGPSLVSRLFVGERAVDLEIDGALALVVDDRAAIAIVDLTDQDAPKIIARYDKIEHVRDVALSGRIAFVANGGPLRIVDLADPAAPQVVPFAPLDVGYPGPDSLRFSWVAWHGDRLYGKLDWNRLVIFDVSDPTKPKLVGSFVPQSAWADVEAPGGPLIYAPFDQSSYSYAPGSFFVIDAANPTALRPVWTQVIPGRMRDLDVRDDAIYVAARDAGLLVYAVPSRAGEPTATRTSRPTATPPPVTPVPTQAPDPLRPHRVFLPVLQRPALPSKNSVRLNIDRQFGGVSSAVAADGEHAFLLESERRLLVLNIADPREPMVVGMVTFPAEILSLPDYTVVAMLPDGDRVHLVTASRQSESGTSYLITVDVSQPAHPRHMGTLKLAGASLAAARSGRFLFVHTYGLIWDQNSTVGLRDPGLQVIDVGDPRAPRVVGKLANQTPLVAMLVIDNRLIGLGTPDENGPPTVDQLESYDITDPARPVALGRLELEETGYPLIRTMIRSGQEWLVFNMGSEAGRFRLNARGVPELVQTIHLGPYERFLGNQDSTFYRATDIAAYGRHLYLLQREGPVVLVQLDLQDLRETAPPQAMVLLADTYDSVRIDQPALGMVATEDGALIANGWSGGMRIVDPARPGGQHQVGAYAPPGITWDMTAQDKLLYLGGQGTFEILDVTDPLYPTRRGIVASSSPGPSNFNRLAIGESLAFIAQKQQIEVIDIRDPAAPMSVGALGGSAGEFDFLRIATDGTRAYVVDAKFGLRVIGVSGESVFERMHFATVGGARDVDVQAGRAYLATTAGLEIVDVSAPTAPFELGFLDLSGEAAYVAVDGTWVYIITIEPRPGGWLQPRWQLAELTVVDAADPRNPRRVAMLQLPVNTTGELQVVDDLLWIGGESMIAIDIRDPSRPELAGVFPGSSMYAVSPNGRHAFLGGAELTIATVERR